MTLTAGVGDHEWWKFFIMPFMSGIVGWATNVLALQMTFYPIEFLGVQLYRPKEQPWGLFGWQGIIPTKAEKMARICTKLMMTRLLNLKVIFNRLDPEKFYQTMEDALLLMIDEIIQDVASTYMTNTWYYMPQNAKDEIVSMANRACPQFLSAFIADMQANIETVLDIETMTIKACVEKKEIINQIFLECGEAEFTFIRRSGFYFGFLFGCVQMGVWFGFDKTWVLPICGFVVGWLTNYLALKVIFRPLNPIPISCGKYACREPILIHGLFLKRQNEVSETFAKVVCRDLLTTEKIWGEILNGPRKDNFHLLLHAHTIVFTEKLMGGLQSIALAVMGKDQYAAMKEDVAQKVIQKIPEIIGLSYDYTTEAMDLENTMRRKMQNLNSAEFEGVLHPAFEEDEILLILVGGVLGALVGVIQMFAIF